MAEAKLPGILKIIPKFPFDFGVFNLPATGAYIPFMRCLNSGGG